MSTFTNDSPETGSHFFVLLNQFISHEIQEIPGPTFFYFYIHGLFK